jgi:hypothetical protein
MTQSLFAALLICFVSGPVSSQGVKPNFTGKWSLDAAKSDFGQTPPPESIVHVIDHKEPNVKITTTTKSEMGEATSEQSLSTDGKETVNKMQAMGTEQEVKVIGRWDGEKLAASWSFEMKGATISFSDSWALSDGGKVLTLLRVAQTPQGNFTVTTIYNKR